MTTTWSRTEDIDDDRDVAEEEAAAAASTSSTPAGPPPETPPRVRGEGDTPWTSFHPLYQRKLRAVEAYLRRLLMERQAARRKMLDTPRDPQHPDQPTKKEAVHFLKEFDLGKKTSEFLVRAAGTLGGTAILRDLQYNLDIDDPLREFLVKFGPSYQEIKGDGEGFVVGIDNDQLVRFFQGFLETEKAAGGVSLQWVREHPDYEPADYTEPTFDSITFDVLSWEQVLAFRGMATDNANGQTTWKASPAALDALNHAVDARNVYRAAKAQGLHDLAARNASSEYYLEKTDPEYAAARERVRREAAAFEAGLAPEPTAAAPAAEPEVEVPDLEAEARIRAEQEKLQKEIADWTARQLELERLRTTITEPRERAAVDAQIEATQEAATRVRIVLQTRFGPKKPGAKPLATPADTRKRTRAALEEEATRAANERLENARIAARAAGLTPDSAATAGVPRERLTGVAARARDELRAAEEYLRKAHVTLLEQNPFKTRTVAGTTTTTARATDAPTDAAGKGKGRGKGRVPLGPTRKDLRDAIRLGNLFNQRRIYDEAAGVGPMEADEPAPAAAPAPAPGPVPQFERAARGADIWGTPRSLEERTGHRSVLGGRGYPIANNPWKAYLDGVWRKDPQRGEWTGAPRPRYPTVFRPFGPNTRTTVGMRDTGMTTLGYAAAIVQSRPTPSILRPSTPMVQDGAPSVLAFVPALRPGPQHPFLSGS